MFRVTRNLRVERILILVMSLDKKFNHFQDKLFKKNFYHKDEDIGQFSLSSRP